MNEMNNFEKACFDACENFVNSIEIIEEPIYSTKHIKKMNSITNGIRVGKVYFNRKTAMILVACILILTMNIVAFAYIGSQSKNKSKDLVFFSANPVKIENYESGSSIEVRVKGSAPYEKHKPFDDLKYGYIPEGYENYKTKGNSPITTKTIFGKEETDNRYRYLQKEFEKYENGKAVGRITIYKQIEEWDYTLCNSTIYIGEGQKPNDIKDDILNNSEIEIESPDLYEFMKRVSDFEEDGIHYYFIRYEDEGVGGELLWNYNGYLYMLNGIDIPFEELTKIAKDVK